MGLLLIFSSIAGQVALCFIPILLNLDVNWQTDNHTSSSLQYALKSVEYKIALSYCIAFGIPLLLVIIRDCLFSRIDIITGNNFLLLFVLMVPDIILFSYVLPSYDLKFFVCFYHGRSIILYSTVYWHLYLCGSDFFKKKSCRIWYISACVSAFLFLSREFSHDRAKTVYWSSLALLLASYISYLTVLFLWFRRQYIVLVEKKRSFSTNEYRCNVCITASVICFSGLFITWLAFGTPDFPFFSSSFLMISEIFYGLFYVVIFVFQQGIIRRDIIMEVRHSNSLFLWHYTKKLVTFQHSPPTSPLYFFSNDLE